jgi:hypothetical protein
MKRVAPWKALLVVACLSLTGCWNGECGGVRFINPLTFKHYGTGITDAQAQRYNENARAVIGLVSGLGHR